MKKFIENLIFNSKWFLIPFYLVLIASLIVYTYFDITEFIHFVTHLKTIDKEAAMLTFIELIDMAMIANLGKILCNNFTISIYKNKYCKWIIKNVMKSYVLLENYYREQKMKEYIMNFTIFFQNV